MFLVDDGFRPRSNLRGTETAVFGVIFSFIYFIEFTLLAAVTLIRSLPVFDLLKLI